MVDATESVAVEVVWATGADVQTVHVQPLRLCAGATVGDAIAAAHTATGHLFAANQDAGIWGKLQPRSAVLCDGDRVELYQPLKVDPKKARRERFAKQGARRAGLFAQRRPQSKQGYGA